MTAAVWVQSRRSTVLCRMVMALRPLANNSKARITWAELEVPGLQDKPYLYGHPFGLRGQSQMNQLLAQ